MLEESLHRTIAETDVLGINTTSTEIFAPKFTGEIFDRLIHAETGEVLEERHGFNIVVDNCSRLIAALLKNHTGYSGKGVMYWEVGSGLSSWTDDNPPAPLKTDTALLTPLQRKAVAAADIVFLDGNNAVTSAITNKLQIKVRFGTTEANGYLREFGLFGGADATATNGTGLMINRKTHGVIYKTSAMELERTLRLTL